MKALRQLLLAVLFPLSVAAATNTVQVSVVSTGGGGATYTEDFSTAGVLTGNWSTIPTNTGISASGGVGIQTTGGDNGSIYTGGTFDDDQYSQMTVNTLYGDVYQTAAAVRCSNTQFTCYFVEFNDENWRFSKTVNGSYTADTTQTKAISTGVEVKLMVNGSVLSVSFDDVTEAYTWTDTDITTGYPGIYLYGSASQEVDDWSGGSN